MKDVYFQMLDFERKIPDNYSFSDMGYTDSLMDKAKEVIENMGYEPTEKILEELGFPIIILRHNRGGIHISTTRADGGKHSFIFYNRFPEAKDIHNRAHEETHAISNLGLRKDLEKMIGVSNLEQLCEEDFCDQAGIYILRKKSIEIPPDLIISYEKRLALVSKRFIKPDSKYIVLG